MSIRPYQEEALESTVEERNAGVACQLGVLPCGCGKTIIASHLIRHHPLKRGEQMLFLAHRTELISQAVRKLRQYNPLLRVQPHTGEHEADRDCDVIVSSVQTIGRMTAAGHTKRLTKFDPDRVRIVVCDEVHRATAESYRNVFRYFKVLKSEPGWDNSKLFLGITATSQRSDGVGLECLFQKIVFERSIRQMIGEGWLSRIRGKMIQTDADITGVKSRKDDFVPGELSEALNTPERNDLIVRRYEELGEDMPAIAFTIDVKHSHDLAEEFHRHGVTAFPVSGSTPENDRQAAFAAFEQRRCKVLISCEVLVEGFDRPMASVALMARPTKSSLWYCQAVGRVLRPYPAPEDSDTHDGWRKPHALVLDFSDTCGRHSLNTTPSLFGLRHDFDMAGQDVVQTVEEIEQLQVQQPKLDLKNCKDLIEVRSHVRDIDLLKEVVVPPVVKQHSRFQWTEDGNGGYQLALPDKGMLLVSLNALGFREVWKSKNGVRLKHAVLRTLPEALKAADALIPSKLAGQMGTDAAWASKAPTEKQIKYLWQIDRDLRKKWPTVGNTPGWHPLFQYATEQYAAGKMMWSRPTVGAMIGRHSATRDLKQAGFEVKEA
jgi:ATP-dependent helicase IRC3